MQISANGIRLEVEIHGPASGPPLLLIMGLGMQLTAWDIELVRHLVVRGFRVIRFDNRDIGLSQHFDELGVPHLGVAALKHWLHLPQRSPYRLADMAADALGVLDALSIQRAHVWGASMGGMIAQHVAARAPARVASLTLMMTSSGARHLPGPTLKVQAVMLARAANSVAGARAHALRLMRAIGSPAYPPPPNWLEERVEASLARSLHPIGMQRQLQAVVADGDRRPLLQRIQAPTLVIHGLADPLVPVAAGRELAQLIPAARADFIAGMGHDLPPQLFERFAQALVEQAERT